MVGLSNLPSCQTKNFFQKFQFFRSTSLIFEEPVPGRLFKKRFIFSAKTVVGSRRQTTSSSSSSSSSSSTLNDRETSLSLLPPPPTLLPYLLILSYKVSHEWNFNADIVWLSTFLTEPTRDEDDDKSCPRSEFRRRPIYFQERLSEVIKKKFYILRGKKKWPRDQENGFPIKASGRDEHLLYRGFNTSSKSLISLSR